MNDQNDHTESDDMTMQDVTIQQAPAADLGTRAARWLGDLDHPFYDDERNRWVWYEASAIGLQTALLGTYVMAGVLVLIDGSRLNWILAMMMPITFAAIVTSAHVNTYAATYAPGMFDLKRSRGMAAGAVVAFFVFAVLFSGWRDGSATSIGFALALLFGGVVGVAGARYQRNQELRALDAEDLD